MRVRRARRAPRRAGARRPHRSAPASRSASVSPTQTIGISPCVQRRLRLLGDQRVALAVHARAAPSGRRSRSGSRTRPASPPRPRPCTRPARGSSSPARPSAIALPASSVGDVAEIRRRHADRDVAGGQRRRRRSAGEQRGVGGTAAVHLPVADDQLAPPPHAAGLCRSPRSTSLPMCAVRFHQRMRLRRLARPERLRGSPA